MAKKKRVWILGAGFSRSLGGPLLSDLLSPAASIGIRSRYPSMFPAQELEDSLSFFHYWSGFQDGYLPRMVSSPKGVNLWRDAEHFLEELDVAAGADGQEDALKELWDVAFNRVLKGISRRPDFPGVEVLRDRVRRIVAASCSLFLEGLGDVHQKERWLPYLRWMGELSDSDTILSFNYDRVVELLNPIVDSITRGAFVVSPKFSDEEQELEEEHEAAGCPQLLKLHGSVEWCLDAEGKIDELLWAAGSLDKSVRLAIATPGAEKMALTEKFFKKLWRLADTALIEADEVYILGCRFPQSDAKARDSVMDALARNDNERLCVYTVLGPDTAGGDSKRMIELLGWSLGAMEIVDTFVGSDLLSNEPITTKRRLAPCPLWVEDFLGAWSRGAA